MTKTFAKKPQAALGMPKPQATGTRPKQAGTEMSKRQQTISHNNKQQAIDESVTMSHADVDAIGINRILAKCVTPAI